MPGDPSNFSSAFADLAHFTRCRKFCGVLLCDAPLAKAGKEAAFGVYVGPRKYVGPIF